ncbi:MAG TPA: Spy/CpxP family protein refolding chaperone [Nevskia sp.]|nr:Spy/CpxP family protein refolding chaperone [Nevskia sp.]
MRKLMLVPAAILAAGMLSTAVHAQDQGPGDGGPGWHHHHRGGAMMHELKALNLSDSQKASVKTLFKSSREQLKPQFQAMMAQRQAFNSAVPGSPEFNSAESALAQAASSAASARVQQEAALRTQIYALLSDAQKQQLATLQAQHQAKMAEWQAKHAQSAD